MLPRGHAAARSSTSTSAARPPRSQDLADRIAERLPLFIALVVGLSVLLLMAVFRSLWVPLVSALFNLLSIAAAYGVVVAVFQWGWGARLLGVDGSVPIVSFVPLFMFAILFGLSMDYNVFLQSRIREEYNRGAGPAESVVLSDVARRPGDPRRRHDHDHRLPRLRHRPGRGGQDDRRRAGGAIAIDVLVVRMVVAPAVMTLLGERAWRLPRWLDRVLPKIALEGDLVEPVPEGA